MKKYLILGVLFAVQLAQAQYYQHDNTYEYQHNRDWQYYDEGFYDYAYNHFPDDYYYEYPIDYYPTRYYESYYNDYRQSILGINWESIFVEFRLSPMQIHQIMRLNNRFSDFSFWYEYYGTNPDRWYYDRFYALERILGTRIFAVFQNRYYNGYAPITYFRNYKIRHYARRYRPIRRYRNMNVNIYNIGRDRYFEHYGNGYVRNAKESPFRSDGFINSDNTGFRNNNQTRQGYRNNTTNIENRWKTNKSQSERTNNKSFPNGATTNGFRTEKANNRGFRNSENTSKNNNHFEQNKAEQRGFSSGGFR